jgi:hypothetical protein
MSTEPAELTDVQQWKKTAPLNCIIVYIISVFVHDLRHPTAAY